MCVGQSDSAGVKAGLEPFGKCADHPKSPTRGQEGRKNVIITLLGTPDCLLIHTVI